MAACWGERRRGAHLQGRAAAGGRQGAAGAHPGPAGLPEVGRVVPTDAWQGGCGAVAREKQSRSDPQARGTTAPGRVGTVGQCQPSSQGEVLRPRCQVTMGSSRTGSSAHPACAPCVSSAQKGALDMVPCHDHPASPPGASGLPQQDHRTGPTSPRTAGGVGVMGLRSALRPVPSPEVVGAAAGSPQETTLVKRGRGWPPIHCQFPWSHW